MALEARTEDVEGANAERKKEEKACFPECSRKRQTLLEINTLRICDARRGLMNKTTGVSAFPNPSTVHNKNTTR